jgi:hypothetical protein
MKGLAYVFLRKDGAPLPPGFAGHVGWGFNFERQPGNWDAFCGSTENPTGAAFIKPGDGNGYWDARTDKEEEMFRLFRRRNYHAFKVAKVEKIWPDNAALEAKSTKAAGYTAIGNNCLDHVFRILKVYGVMDLPWPSTHPSPNDWFGSFNGTYRDL